ncbi:hypothetical protein VTO73DRAFT_4910 [Trametes versicolor]
MHLQGFSDWFTAAAQPDSSRRSTDPVTQLWDVFALGVPLCYLFNLLPSTTPIQVNTDVQSYDPSNERTRKHAIALFSMNVKQVSGCEGFTVRDLWDRNSTDGFVKVVSNVINLVEQLPDDLFMATPPASPKLSSALASTESLTSDNSLVASTVEPGGARANIIKELVDTERKYVQDLEVMQRYCDEAVKYIDRDTLHLLFPGLNKLLNFQRKFLIKVESIAELSWNEQRWGVLFSENEEDFAVYEPYCANYTMASEIMIQEELNLTALNHIINVKGELPAFLIKPVQRICKYPLLLESLLKAVNNTEYNFVEELKAGVGAAKRITDKINEAQRRAENDATVKNLEGRVEDWKGHHISNFGSLLLDDVFSVTKSEVDREYHVFLFEKIILCCKEYVPQPGNGKKVGKSNSILKKPSSPSSTFGPGPSGSKKKSTPLLLKGRIFLNNVTQAVPKNIAGQYSLAVWWRGDDDLEFFTLRCRNEEQLKMWENQLNRLIKETASRRTSDRNVSRLAQVANSTNPSPQIRSAHNSYAQERSSMFSQSTGYSSGVPFSATINGSRSMRHPYANEEHALPSASAHSHFSNGFVQGGPQGYPPHDGFELDPEDEYEDYPPTSANSASGRGTPMGQQRRPDFPYPQSARNSGQASSPILSGGMGGFQPPASARPAARSTSSYASEASFAPSVQSRPTLRSKFSSTRLAAAYEQSDSRGASPMPTHQPMRSRSASQPSAYHHHSQQPPPPLPTSAWIDRSQNSLPTSKRGSGSSQSTGDSSDYSPHTSSSPITPYGSSESSLAGVSMGRSGRSHMDPSMGPPPLKEELRLSPPVKIKVHFGEDIFVIQVPRSTEYAELVDKVGKKIRLCGPRRDDGPLRVKYKDEDGDLVSLGSTEDVQMAFESFRPGNQVTLYVQ